MIADLEGNLMSLLSIEMDALVTRSLVALHGEDELYLI